MAYSHSFSDDFYMVEDDDQLRPIDFEDGRLPTTVWQAILAMPEADYQEMCRELFNREDVEIGDIMSMIRDTDTVGTFSSPVDVWIDSDGYFSINVYEETE